MKDFLKKVFTNNIGWKILAVLAACIFWIIAVNIIDPVTKRTFEDIPVEVLNESAITSSDQVYEIKSGDRVNVTITSKRSLVERLHAADFTATADLAEMSSVNAVRIQVKLDRNTDVDYELDWNNAVMKLKLEARVTSKFKVQVISEGELGEGYVLGDVIAKPNIIEVSGGESKMKKIDHVSATVQLNGETEEFVTKAQPMAYDSSGDLVDATKLTFSEKEVRLSVGVRRTMAVPIEITTVGVPADGYHLVQTDRQPESVTVSAYDSSKLTSDLKIKLEIDIDGATADVEKEVDISSYLGDDYVIEDENKVVSIRCEISRSGERNLYITYADLEVNGVKDKYSLSFLDQEARYSIELSGSNEKLTNIEVKDLGAYIDVTNLDEGTHNVAVMFDPPDGVRIMNSVSVDVLISRIETDATEEPEEEEEPEPEPETTEEPQETPFEEEL
ncbi:MAG: hypothetical protein J6P16_03540 [Eubacterium sp.]|nr:hypothetical protein [Eubacterium sp.]